MLISIGYKLCRECFETIQQVCLFAFVAASQLIENANIFSF